MQKVAGRTRQISPNDQFFDGVYGNRREILQVPQNRMHRLIRSQSSGDINNSLRAILRDKYRHSDSSDSGNIHLGITFQIDTICVLAFKVVVEQIKCCINPCSVPLRLLACEEVLQKNLADISIQSIMLELILVATQAAIAGSVALVGAVFEDREGTFEHRQAQIADLPRKPGAARERVIQIDLDLFAGPSKLRQRRPEFRLQLGCLKLKNRTGSLRECLAESPKSYVCRKQ